MEYCWRNLDTNFCEWYNDLTLMGLGLVMRILDMYTVMMFSFN